MTDSLLIQNFLIRRLTSFGFPSLKSFYGWMVLGALPWTVSAAPPFVAGLSSDNSLSPALAGRILISELSCTSCHLSEDPSLAPKKGPDLTDVGLRVRPGFLQQFLSDPQGTHPGTTMPDMLSGLDPGQRDDVVLALSHFLVASATNPAPAALVQSEAVDRGRALYHRVGCVACHTPEEPLPDSVPLGPLEEKYTMSGLTGFLQDPLAIRPSGRMPDLQLSAREAADIAAYLLGERSPVPEVRSLDGQLIEEGRQWFNRFQCGTCHMDDGEAADTRAVALEELDESQTEHGCLSEINGDWPHYDLSPGQREAIRTALATPSSPDNETHIRLALTRFNCIACHVRGEVGGVTQARDPYFQTEDPNLGEQGRLPPSLTGVGAKLNPVWLRKILVQGASSRPYLHTRMPVFGADPMEALIADLLAADQIPAKPPLAMDNHNENEIKQIGRELAGSEGLSCVTCHTVKGLQSGPMGALDMTLMAQRVTRDWFHLYLANPQQFSPSTIMPAFWPPGQPVLPEVLGGDRDLQIEALWKYLSDGYSIGTPRGVRHEPMRLVSDEVEAVMLRRSYPGVGKRGIGVGFPSGANIVFHAERLGLAMLWWGEFVDPAGVWTSQGHGTARPLGRARIEFSEPPELVPLENIQEPWPAIEGRPAQYQFDGYRLDEKRRPTFRYSIGPIMVEDSFVDSLNNGRPVLRRSLVLHSTEAEVPLVFRAASHASLSALDNNRFEAGPHLEILILGDLPASIITTGDTRELRVPISWRNGRGNLALEYRQPDDQ